MRSAQEIHIETERSTTFMRISMDTRMTISQVLEEARRSDTAVMTILTEMHMKGASITS